MEWGIVTKVVPDANLQAEADTLAAQLAAGATGAFGGAKRLLHSGFSETLETQMELEAQVIATRAHTADGKEGISAFLEKRTAKFVNK
jgi:2-(1,2-epoxy-1,2-dihydrophenyl)acetyl-CoA isomerase